MDHTLFGPGEIAMRLAAAVLALVFANGFFVAAEFALVTVRKTRIDQLIAEGSRLARPVRRAITDPDSYIAATQLAITMTSLGLGWIGEPAVSSMIQPALGLLPVPLREATSHTIAVALGFAVITALHIVLGELAPKTVALQHRRTHRPHRRAPDRALHAGLLAVHHDAEQHGRAVVRMLGLKPPSGSSLVHSEEELKMLVTASQEGGPASSRKKKSRCSTGYSGSET